MSKVSDRDKGWKRHGKMVTRQARRTPYVNVGILGPDAVKSHADARLTTVEVASFHEFGRGNNPERSFIRAVFDSNNQKYIRLMRRFADQVLAGRLTQRQALSAFGEKVRGDTLGFMRQGISPDKATGGTARLKVTGQLYGSLIYEVGGL